MDFVDQDLIDLIHDRVGFFWAEFIDHSGKSFHIAEHNRNLLAFTLYPVSLR